MNDKTINWLFKNKTLLLFVVLSFAAFQLSGQSVNFVVNQLMSRFTRNTFLVLSLLIPIQAGMGLNFGMVIGAISAQIAVFTMSYLEIGGIGGFLLCVVMTLPISMFFGFLVGNLFNRMKGSEMIGGMIVRYFSDGLYQLLFLFILGGVIPLAKTDLLIPGGVGVKNTIDLTGGLKYALDDLLKLDFLDVFLFGTIALVIYTVIVIVRKYKGDLKKSGARRLLFNAGVCVIAYFLTYIPAIEGWFKNTTVPIVTVLCIGGLCLFNTSFMRTVLGQNMRTVGQSMSVAKASGINVDKVRIIAMIMSTVIAGWGQLIYLQNMGTFSTYGAHSQIGEYAIAALLVGGASVHSATNKQAIIGVILFHTLFIVSPDAGNNLFNSAQIGEYFRVFVCYGVIAVSLALHAWKGKKKRVVA